MSGGHYNYAYFKMTEMAETIQEDLDDEDNHLSDAVRKVMEKFVADLLVVADKAKALEWFMSADDSEETFLETFKNDGEVP